MTDSHTPMQRHVLTLYKTTNYYMIFALAYKKKRRKEWANLYTIIFIYFSLKRAAAITTNRYNL